MKRPEQGEVEQALQQAQQAQQACFSLKTRGLIPLMTEGDPEATLQDAVRQLKALAQHWNRISN
jgi:hypothetical protein